MIPGVVESEAGAVWHAWVRQEACFRGTLVFWFLGSRGNKISLASCSLPSRRITLSQQEMYGVGQYRRRHGSAMLESPKCRGNMVDGFPDSVQVRIVV